MQRSARAAARSKAAAVPAVPVVAAASTRLVAGEDMGGGMLEKIWPRLAVHQAAGMQLTSVVLMIRSN